MDRYQLIRGFSSDAEAREYADRLPPEARAKVVPYRADKDCWKFAVDVRRTYTAVASDPPVTASQEAASRVPDRRTP